MTAEACTTVSSTRFQVTSAARRCIDPTQPWHVTVSGATLAYTSISSFDFLFGEINTTAPLAAAPTLTATFIPLTTASEFVSEVKGHSLTEQSEVLDTTVYTSTSPFRKRTYGLADASISVDMLLNVNDMARLATLMSTGADAFIDINTGASPYFRAIGKVVSIERSATVDGLVEATVEWQLAAARDDRLGTIVGYSERNLASSA
jgi:hypothetical protein